MGIFEVHFHDSRFEWTINPGTDDERSLSFGVGSASEGVSDGGRSRGDQSRPSIAPKLKSVAALGLVVGAAAALNRIQSRRAQKARRTEEESTGRRLSLGRSK